MKNLDKAISFFLGLFILGIIVLGVQFAFFPRDEDIQPCTFDTAIQMIGNEGKKCHYGFDDLRVKENTSGKFNLICY